MRASRRWLPDAGSKRWMRCRLMSDEPERLVALYPDRSFAELRRDFPRSASARRSSQRQPASTQCSCPVISRASSDGKEQTPVRRCLRGRGALSGTERRRSPPRPQACTICSCRGVRTLPGTTQVTRILSGPRSRANAACQPFDRRLASLIENQVRQSEVPADRAEVRRSPPPPFRRMPGITACAQKKMCLRFTLTRLSQ